MSWILLGSALRARLISSLATSTVSGWSVHIDEAAQGTAYPYIVVSKADGSDDNVFATATIIREYLVQVDVYTAKADGTDTHETLVDDIETAIRRKSVTITGWQVGHMVPQSRNLEAEVEDNARRTSLDFSIVMSK